MSGERQPTRAELIARIAASSKDAVVLKEMQRSGFWPKDAAAPTVEAALIQREAELVQVLNKLQAELREKGDPQAALKAMRQQRMAEAKERREATAQKLERERYERALQWRERSRHEIGYLGQGVSAGLQPRPDNAGSHEKLQRQGLPLLDTPQALADAMGVPVAELRFLAFHREVARTQHYRRFSLPKKTGGVRTISAPMPRLKRAQYWVLDNVLAKVTVHAAAHGFLPGRSIVSNAAPHAGQAVVINLDLKDFFPSVAYPRIKGVFRALGYSEATATLLALLCSENVCDELQVDGERFFVGRTARERVLPQGAPTSPMLTNILCRRLDKRLQGIATKLGFTYTRYADDLSFSASGEAASLTGRLLRQVHHILKAEGFTPHPDKQHVMHAGRRQEVTGVVVNKQPAVSREQRRALRAALHRATHQGVEAATWQGEPAARNVLLGYAQFVTMVNARHGAPLLAQAKALPSAASAPSAMTKAVPSGQFRRHAAEGKAPPRANGAWWQPAPKPEPVLLKTAGQIKAERQARLAEVRAERQAAKVTATQAATPRRLPRTATPPSAAAASDLQQETHAPLLPRMRWEIAAAQVAMLIYLSVRLKSPGLFMIGSLWLGWRVMRRKFGWTGYFVAMLVIGVAALMLRL
ncbi:MAG TPA: reverse transcriptase family protein [Ideonella sp.]|uniref:reverse transcriptase family protein n=1 Tax=Ideonella sp. TaxID=1929293 RepID=UPI002C34FD96|nr:reverse transcriptase family protein [Ideonella sp.]HSI51133.1 reverse transcriptase family protein [Ideonella sp.]